MESTENYLSIEKETFLRFPPVLECRLMDKICGKSAKSAGALKIFYGNTESIENYSDIKINALRFLPARMTIYGEQLCWYFIKLL